MRQISYFQNPKLSVREAGHKGRGVFASVRMVKGEIIEIAPALPVPKRDDHRVLATFLVRYVFETERGGRHVIGLGWTSLLNHSPSPNVDFFATTKTVTMKARRAIRAEEELTIDYAWSVAEWAAAGVVLKIGSASR